jgi:tetratricopeptide (TPR) repeat protein
VDLRRAVALDPSTRVLHVYLIRQLQDRGEWDASLVALKEARARFPEDFNLALLEARSLIKVDRAGEAVEILSTVHVLPSENARQSHSLWEQAHTQVAQDALEAQDYSQAIEHLQAALEWPESLGQGRPYEPEESLVRFLLGLAENRMVLWGPTVWR